MISGERGRERNGEHEPRGPLDAHSRERDMDATCTLRDNSWNLRFRCRPLRDHFHESAGPEGDITPGTGESMTGMRRRHHRRRRRRRAACAPRFIARRGFPGWRGSGGRARRGPRGPDGAR